MPSIPEDYLHRVYAGVLGKLIGVYLGRPFENWTHDQILEKLGPIRHYVHDKFNVPCVVIDDDVSGTFTFIKALEEHGITSALDLTSKQIGDTWLNNVIERRSVFWWGGNGISTEHTAYLNLKKRIEAPGSGSMVTNGRTLAEQIGAQIFIDGWALVAPGNPEMAAGLAEAAARVSHDGEAVYAAKLWAAVEAEAFVSKDVNHLLDTGLRFIPPNSVVAKLISDIRGWFQEDGEWQATRQKIEDKYGYDKYSGICHVIPNHGIMILALLYGGHDFSEAMHIVNTCGWDTDCNSGNVGCLVALMHGLNAFDGDLDWRGSIADRALISGSDNGYAINDAARIAYEIAGYGAVLAGEAPPDPPPAQFHFSLPGSVQGFQPCGPSAEYVSYFQRETHGKPGLIINVQQGPADTIDVSTPTFTPADVLAVSRNYEMMASPLIYPGQVLNAHVSAADTNPGPIPICLRLKAYDETDTLITVDSDPVVLDPLSTMDITWTIPPTLQNKPIQQVGLAFPISPPAATSICLHTLSWSATPIMKLQRPSLNPNGVEHANSASFWEKSWVSSVDKFHSQLGPSFYIARDSGEGIISHGTRDWTDYAVTVHWFVVNLGAPAGVAVRVRGLRRWYALMFLRGGRVGIVKARDGERKVLSSECFDWKLDVNYELRISVCRSRIRASVGGVGLCAVDDEYNGGAVGLVVTDGSLSAESIDVGPEGSLEEP